MLVGPMRLADQWRKLEEALPAGWSEARLSLTTEQASELARAAAVLGPLGAGRRNGSLVFTVQRAGGASGPEAARRLFAVLDRERVWSTLRLEEVRAAAAPAQEPAPLPLAEAWDAELAALPEDWSDLLCRLELDSSDYLPRAALLCAPVNPTRDPDAIAFLFRCARRAGYGVSPGMARRCLERCDAEGITGSVAVLRALSETDNVATQGPVWYVGGRVL
jgi:hypothetical protein